MMEHMTHNNRNHHH
jgi:hypothetical protein